VHVPFREVDDVPALEGHVKSLLARREIVRMGDVVPSHSEELIFAVTHHFTKRSVDLEEAAIVVGKVHSESRVAKRGFEKGLDLS
jgi:hypothetical protein